MNWEDSLGECVVCHRTQHPVADNGMCWECWSDEQDKATVDFSKRRRWDFMTGLYYYSLKPSEAAKLGHLCGPDVAEVRLYQGGTIMVVNPRTSYKLEGIQ